jgi:hypothetical protein
VGSAARTVSAALEDVTLHLEVAVLGAQLDVGRQHHLYVLLLLGQRSRSASAYRRHHGEGKASDVGWRIEVKGEEQRARCWEWRREEGDGEVTGALMCGASEP